MKMLVTTIEDVPNMTNSTIKDVEGKVLLAIRLAEEFTEPIGRLISSVVNLSEGAVTQTLQKLEEKKLIVREDGVRPRPNYLTVEGEKALEEWKGTKRGATLYQKNSKLIKKRLEEIRTKKEE